MPVESPLRNRRKPVFPHQVGIIHGLPWNRAVTGTFSKYVVHPPEIQVLIAGKHVFPHGNHIGRLPGSAYGSDLPETVLHREGVEFERGERSGFTGVVNGAGVRIECHPLAEGVHIRFADIVAEGRPLFIERMHAHHARGVSA